MRLQQSATQHETWKGAQYSEHCLHSVCRSVNVSVEMKAYHSITAFSWLSLHQCRAMNSALFKSKTRHRIATSQLLTKQNVNPKWIRYELDTHYTIVSHSLGYHKHKCEIVLLTNGHINGQLNWTDRMRPGFSDLSAMLIDFFGNSTCWATVWQNRYD